LLTIYKELCKDDTPMVRRTAASNLAQISKSMAGPKVKSELIPIWAKFM